MTTATVLSSGEQKKKRIVCMLVLIVLLFTLSWFPFFTVQLYLLTDDVGHRNSAIRTTVAVLQLVGYRYFHLFILPFSHINDAP